jgi:hypothetical protein
LSWEEPEIGKIEGKMVKSDWGGWLKNGHNFSEGNISRKKVSDWWFSLNSVLVHFRGFWRGKS